MKKILITLLLTLSILISYSQIYPRYEIDSFGQKVVVMTIEQAQKLDNGLDLLELFKKLNLQISDYDSACIKVINDKNAIIAAQKVEISDLKKSANNKNNQIETLQNEISLYQEKVKNLEGQVNNRQSVVDEKNKQIRTMKIKMIVGGIGSAAAITCLLILFLSTQ